MTFKGKFERRPVKQIENVGRPRIVAPSIGLAAALASVSAIAAPAVKSRKAIDPADARGRLIRESARGEECAVRIVGVCNSDPATVVWSHWPGIAGGRGMGLKSSDLCGAYCCSACHDAVDMRVPLPPGATRETVIIDWLHGHLRSLVKLETKGIL